MTFSDLDPKEQIEVVARLTHDKIVRLDQAIPFCKFLWVRPRPR
mgnify:CR=1 FL=1